MDSETLELPGFGCIARASVYAENRPACTNDNTMHFVMLARQRVAPLDELTAIVVDAAASPHPAHSDSMYARTLPDVLELYEPEERAFLTGRDGVVAYRLLQAAAPFAEQSTHGVPALRLWYGKAPQTLAQVLLDHDEGLRFPLCYESMQHPDLVSEGLGFAWTAYLRLDTGRFPRLLGSAFAISQRTDALSVASGIERTYAALMAGLGSPERARLIPDYSRRLNEADAMIALARPLPVNSATAVGSLWWPPISILEPREYWSEAEVGED